MLSQNALPSNHVMLQIQDSIECLMGRGVDMVPCDEGCRFTWQDGTLLQSAQCHPLWFGLVIVCLFTPILHFFIRH